MTDSMNRVARTAATAEAEREAWWVVMTARARKVKAVAEWAAAAVRMADADEALEEAMVLARAAGDADAAAWLEEETAAKAVVDAGVTQTARRAEANADWEAAGGRAAANAVAADAEWEAAADAEWEASRKEAMRADAAWQAALARARTAAAD